MIKHFCDICGNEMSERIKLHLEAQEISGDGYLKTVGDKLMTVDYECCNDCCIALREILLANENEGEKRNSFFSKLKNFLMRK